MCVDLSVLFTIAMTFAEKFVVKVINQGCHTKREVRGHWIGSYIYIFETGAMIKVVLRVPKRHAVDNMVIACL